MESENPYKATFGRTPAVLAGRSTERGLFERALGEGPGVYERIVVYRGPRGVGKTVMLNEIAQIATDRKWLVLHDDASPGFMERLGGAGIPALLKPARFWRRTHVSGAGLSVGPGSVTWTVEPAHARTVPTVRSGLERLCSQAEAKGVGVLLTLDEVQGADMDELRDFGGVVQSLIRQNRDFAVGMAGIDAGIARMINHRGGTFLRRACHVPLSPLSPSDTMDALAGPAAMAGRPLTPAAVALGAHASEGWPFLIQLIGAHAWHQDLTSPHVTAAHVRQALGPAMLAMGRSVYDPELELLSANDQRFLAAMADDRGVSAVSQIALRLGWSPTMTSNYRQRLIGRGMIRPVGHGLVSPTLPFLPQYAKVGFASKTPPPINPQWGPVLDAGFPQIDPPSLER